ncbi:hypothetical protein [Cupriavidus sp. AcVe19-6a]|uniref:hypothetical protein n=1 Tax=Cupriavidus sp. AcVe19-6a TaxID=2821358 RepID=UPI00352E3940
MAGAAGAGLASIAGGKLNELSSAVAKGVDTGNADLNATLGNVAANIATGGIGAIVGGGSGAATAASVDRFNRQLHPDERKWAKDNAKKFAEFYKGKTGDDISAADAENLLLSGGYRLVDAAASKVLGADPVATEYISANSGNLFSATDAERRNPALFGNTNGTPSPEQIALNTSHTPNTQPLLWAVGGGFYYGVGGEAELGFTGLLPTEGKMAFGFGLGGHGWIKGGSSTITSDIFSMGTEFKSGDYRLGTSGALGGQLGPATASIGGQAGIQSNTSTGIGGYAQGKGTLGLVPSVGVGLEGKWNLIEFQYKSRK